MKNNHGTSQRHGSEPRAPLGGVTRRALPAVLVLALAVPGTRAQQSPAGTAPSATAAYMEGRVIVRFERESPARAKSDLMEDLGATLVRRLPLIDAEVWEIQHFTVAAAIDRHGGHPAIRYIQPDHVYSVTGSFPNDEHFSRQWALHNIGQTDATPDGSAGTPDADVDGPEAWDLETGGDVLIGVIDTGMVYTHEDLAANMWVNADEDLNGDGLFTKADINNVDDDGNGFVDDVHGYDFTTCAEFNTSGSTCIKSKPRDSDPLDDRFHGTHVSGILAAEGNNMDGVAGVSWTARLMAIKAFNFQGRGLESDAIDAIAYATLMGVTLTNNSWGGFPFSQAMEDTIAAAGAAGQLFVAGSGNAGMDNDQVPFYPASYDLDNIVAVAATDHEDNLVSLSNFGATSVDLGAPGEDIFSTFLAGADFDGLFVCNDRDEDGYGFCTGTSAAAPHVTGVASLLWSADPGLTHLQVKARILGSTDALPALAGKCVTGGRLNAFNALVAADCSPPGSGDWIVNESCTFQGSAGAPANVIVEGDATLTIANGASLDLDFASRHLLVKAGSHVIVKAGGQIH